MAETESTSTTPSPIRSALLSPLLPIPDDQTFCSMVCNISHVLGGCLAVLGPFALGWRHPYCFAFAIMGFATAKEGFIDPIFETPLENGGLSGGIIDWCGYVTGVGIALGALWIRHLL